jgi:nucleolin
MILFQHSTDIHHTDLFRQIKNVLDVRVAIDRRSGQPRGFAHADFVDVESAVAAKEILEQKMVYGRQLRVDYSGQSKETGRSDRGDGGMGGGERGERPQRSERYERSERPERRERRDRDDSY